MSDKPGNEVKLGKNQFPIQYEMNMIQMYLSVEYVERIADHVPFEIWNGSLLAHRRKNGPSPLVTASTTRWFFLVYHGSMWNVCSRYHQLTRKKYFKNFTVRALKAPWSRSNLLATATTRCWWLRSSNWVLLLVFDDWFDLVNEGFLYRVIMIYHLPPKKAGTARLVWFVRSVRIRNRCCYLTWFNTSIGGLHLPMIFDNRQCWTSGPLRKVIQPLAKDHHHVERYMRYWYPLRIPIQKTWERPWQRLPLPSQRGGSSRSDNVAPQDDQETRFMRHWATIHPFGVAVVGEYRDPKIKPRLAGHGFSRSAIVIDLPAPISSVPKKFRFRLGVSHQALLPGVRGNLNDSSRLRLHRLHHT